jgi:Flp pilus assembly protein TadG
MVARNKLRKRGPVARCALPSGRGRRWAKRGSCDNGQGLVEFALVLPVLALIILGIVKFGIVYNNYIQLTNAVGVGAREFSLERGQSSPCTDAVAAFNNAATGLNTPQLTLTDSINAGTYVSPAESGSNGTCPTLSGDGDSVTLQATYPCDLTIMGINFDPSCTLEASATESVQ